MRHSIWYRLDSYCRSAVSFVVALLVGGLVWLGASPALAQKDFKAECAERAGDGAYWICEKAVKAAPRDPRVRRHFGLSLARAGVYQSSIEQYRKVTELVPNDPVAHFEYAWMLAFVRRYADSVPPMEKAIALKPDYRRALFIASIIYAQLDRQKDRLRVVLAGARLGDRIAMFDAYEMHLNGLGTEKQPAVAFDWLRRAAMAGHVGAMDRLVNVYLNGTLGQPQNLKAAARWATRARTERFGDMRTPAPK